MLSRTITQGRITRTLLAGFGLSILLLLVAGFFGVSNISTIRSSAADLLKQHSLTSNLLEEVQREQKAINAIYGSFARRGEVINRDEVLGQLEEADEAIERIATASARQPEQDTWGDLYKAVTRFSAEAKSLLEDEKGPHGPSRRLFEDHQQVLTLVDKLVESELARANQVKAVLEDVSSHLLRESALFLAAALLLALFIAVYTVRLTSRLVRQMEWQTGELSRVSWHLLENQETTARRFSHELHDELGQSLTAVKANLVSLSDRANGGKERFDDSMKLVDEAIANVRELSQLLRPTILDDFGLSAGLKWLCERFTQRTGIAVDYKSDVEERLADETETHLFRIAQEALTNVARHSSATAVRASLRREGGRIILQVADNGMGMMLEEAGDRRGMGMVGMRARARSAGGDVAVSAAPGSGVQILVSFPYKMREE